MPQEFDKMRLAIKRQIMKDNPSMSDKDAEQRSFAIATSTWKKSHGGKSPMESIEDKNISEKKYDEEGRIVVAENVKFYIEGNIQTIEE
jgi:hypothetical protein